MPPTPHDALAIEDLERFRSLHMYADRQLIQRGEYLAAARILERRVVRGSWWTFAAAAYWLWTSADAFIQYGRTDAGGQAVIGTFLMVLAVMFAVEAGRNQLRVRELRRRIETLFPEAQTRPAHAPAT